MSDTSHDSLGYWLFYAQRCLAYAFADVLRTHCMERSKPVITPSQWGALSVLQDEDGLTIGSISQIRGIDAPTVTGIIKRLEQSGLVERRHDKEDRRVVKVFLTHEGRDILATLTPVLEHFNQCMMHGFSEGEQDRLLAGLQKIIANASQLGPGMGDRFGLLPKEVVYQSYESPNNRDME